MKEGLVWTSFAFRLVQLFSFRVRGEFIGQYIFVRVSCIEALGILGFKNVFVSRFKVGVFFIELFFSLFEV